MNAESTTTAAAAVAANHTANRAGPAARIPAPAAREVLRRKKSI